MSPPVTRPSCLKAFSIAFKNYQDYQDPERGAGNSRRTVGDLTHRSVSNHVEEVRDNRKGELSSGPRGIRDNIPTRIPLEDK
ncbi:hypothetical protein CEXT_199291 [Caerostris extrusa]|uniref:Uncharacterized protein n=1 Tax=Caerostris extrusa TaxID=172846 RepID=A0AAV4WRC9_CAEEX|nr:hypothetical protein CEXT_199291 [Caerostris extrusa]